MKQTKMEYLAIDLLYLEAKIYSMNEYYLIIFSLCFHKSSMDSYSQLFIVFSLQISSWIFY